MNIFIFGIGAVVFGAGILLLLPAKTLALILRLILPIGLIGAGAVLSFAGRGGIGSMMLFAGIALWRRMGGMGSFGPKNAGSSGAEKVSSVRSAALEMELNHETGAMNGLVLVGKFEGSELDQLEQDDLLILYDEIRDDGESIALLDSYLDRRFTGWRENAHFDTGAGQGSTAGTGPMGEKEAYEVLGLAPGAGIEEIRKAHRRLIKSAHPDSGGSTFLAAKINEAKDVLLKSHS